MEALNKAQDDNISRGKPKYLSLYHYAMANYSSLGSKLNHKMYIY